jgi:hypothetical protein
VAVQDGVRVEEEGQEVEVRAVRELEVRAVVALNRTNQVRRFRRTKSSATTPGCTTKKFCEPFSLSSTTMTGKTNLRTFIAPTSWCQLG